MTSNYYPFQGDEKHPIVLCSGMLGFNYNTSNMHFHRYMNGITCNANQGRMSITFNPKSGKTVHISQCLVQMGESNTANNENGSVSGRGYEALWYASEVINDNTVIIHEMHQGDQNNDTWLCDNINSERIWSMSLIVFGWLEDT